MASDHGNQSPRRYRPPGVIPLELWDLWVRENQTLWDSMGEPASFPEVLFNALVELRNGNGRTRSEGVVPPIVRGFDALWVGGGLSKSEPLRARLSQLPIPVYFAQDDTFTGERGGLQLLAAKGVVGWIIDLGQTQLKVSIGTQRWTFARDFNTLPIRDTTPDCPAAQQRLALRAFLGESLRTCSQSDTTPLDTVIFALPSRLDSNGVPEGSSYIGMAGDLSLVEDTLATAGLSANCVLTLNDAELAALSARCDPRLPLHAHTLVITLGFGLGAALLVP